MRCVCCLYGGCLRCVMSCVVVCVYWDDICTPYNVRPTYIIAVHCTVYRVYCSLHCVLYVNVCCMYDWCYMGCVCCTCDVDGAVRGICLLYVYIQYISICVICTMYDTLCVV